MSGFSSDAVDALLYGKKVNVILFNKKDFEACIEGWFTKILKTKIRKVAEEGTAFYPVRKVVVNEQVSIETYMNNYVFDLADNRLLTASTDDTELGELVVICEEKEDQLIISILLKRIMEKESIHISSRSIIAAMGKYSVAKVTLNILSNIEDKANLVMIADSDGDIEGTKDKLSRIIDFEDSQLIIIDKSIEIWLNTDRQILNSIRPFSKLREEIISIIERINLEKLKALNQSFRKLYDCSVD